MRRGQGCGAPSTSAQCLCGDQRVGRGLAAASLPADAVPDLYGDLYVQELRERWIEAHLHCGVKPPYDPLVPTHNRIKRDPTWTFMTIEAGHDSMVIAPDALASLLMAPDW